MVEPLIRHRHAKAAARRHARPKATAPHSYSTDTGRPWREDGLLVQMATNAPSRPGVSAASREAAPMVDLPLSKRLRRKMQLPVARPLSGARMFRRGGQRRPALSAIDSVHAGGALCDAIRPRSWRSAKTGASVGGNMVGPCDEGDATGRGQPVKPPFDPLEPTVDIALKDFGGVRSKCPKVARATWRAGKRVGHGERLLTIGGHLGRPGRTAHDGIPLAATMLLDDARTPFGVAPRLPWRWLRHDVDPAVGGDGEKAEAQESTELLHARDRSPARAPAWRRGRRARPRRRRMCDQPPEAPIRA